MTTVQQVMCNWPGCPRKLAIAGAITQAECAKYGWACNDSDMHLCPDHAPHGLENAQEEINRVWGRNAKENVPKV